MLPGPSSHTASAVDEFRSLVLAQWNSIDGEGVSKGIGEDLKVGGGEGRTCGLFDSMGVPVTNIRAAVGLNVGGAEAFSPSAVTKISTFFCDFHNEEAIEGWHAVSRVHWVITISGAGNIPREGYVQHHDKSRPLTPE